MEASVLILIAVVIVLLSLGKGVRVCPVRGGLPNYSGRGRARGKKWELARKDLAEGRGKPSLFY